MSKQFLYTSAIASVLLVSPSAHAGDDDGWGCKVLVCLSNPGGPTQFDACKPPIKKLYDAMSSWDFEWPDCMLSNGSNSKDGGNYAALGATTYYDDCPEGMTALPDGQNAALGSAVSSTPDWPYGPGYEVAGAHFAGIGDGSGIRPSALPPSYSGSPVTMPTKTCVGTKLGEATITSTAPIYGGGRPEKTIVGIYDNITRIEPSSGYANINVVINNALFKTVRVK
jgi:hypothetical protein